MLVDGERVCGLSAFFFSQNPKRRQNQYDTYSCLSLVSCCWGDDMAITLTLAFWALRAFFLLFAVFNGLMEDSYGDVRNRDSSDCSSVY